MQSPSDLGLRYDDWRPGQRLAIRTALSARTPHVVIQAPTGAGKSVIALALMKLDPVRTAALTSTKGLMDQYSREAEFLFDIRGMGNYKCLAAKDEFRRHFDIFKATGIMCDRGPCRAELQCTLRESGCLYFDRYRLALGSQQIVTNYDYWVSIRRYGRGLGAVGRIICDEAHDVPDKLMSACRVAIPAGLIEGVWPRHLTEWQHWASAKLQTLRGAPHQEERKIKRQHLVESLEAILRIDASWAWERQDDEIVFEPTVPRFLSPHLFEKNQKVVWLSATITSDSISSMLGIPKEDVTFLALRSRFPVERRPVYLVKTARVDYRISQDDEAYWLKRIDEIISRRTDRKGIIHTVSYARQAKILANSKFAHLMVAPTCARELISAVERFKQADRPLVLVSPSVTTGFDFPDDTCRYQILAKMPFADMRSPIMKARLRATPGYREYLAMQTLVQATGRPVRSVDDWAETFLIDDHSRWFLTQHEELAPRWFLDALVLTGRVPPPATRF